MFGCVYIGIVVKNKCVVIILIKFVVWECVLGRLYFFVCWDKFVLVFILLLLYFVLLVVGFILEW